MSIVNGWKSVAADECRWSELYGIFGNQADESTMIIGLVLTSHVV